MKTFTKQEKNTLKKFIKREIMRKEINLLHYPDAWKEELKKENDFLKNLVSKIELC
jgi:septin family protein